MFRGKEYVYEVFKEKSFSKAAQNLYISQPALSAAIKRIENLIGCPIFDRSTRAVSLTDGGVEYIRAIETIMDVEAQFENHLSNLNSLKAGRLAIGASHVFASFILPVIMTQFTREYPAIRIDLFEAPSIRLEDLLFSGTIDFVVDNYPLDETVFQKHAFFNEHLILAVPEKFAADQFFWEYRLSIDDICKNKHQSQEVRPVPLCGLAQIPFILLRSGNDTRIRADRIFQAVGFTPKIVLELDQLATAYNVACYGMGAAIISDTLARKANRQSNMHYFKIDSPHAVRDVFFYNKKNKYITRAMDKFINIAQTTDIR